MSDNIPPTRIFNNFNFHTNCFSKSYILWKPWLKTKRWAQSKQNCKSNYRDPNSGSWTADLRRKTVSVILSLFTECTENDCHLLRKVQHWYTVLLLVLQTSVNLLHLSDLNIDDILKPCQFKFTFTISHSRVFQFSSLHS